jgi:phage tail tape-measure protein
MPERVVDELEVIEVEHDRSPATAVTRDPSVVSLELALEAATVEQSGERVVIGEVTEALLVASLIGDVLDLGEEPEWPVFGVA